MELLQNKYGLLAGQRCAVRGESRDGLRWLVEGGQQILKSDEEISWTWRLTQSRPGDVLFLWPSEIGFTQDSIGPVFRDGRTLDTSWRELATRKRKREVDPINVIFAEGKFYTLNNRRLAVYRLLEIEGACHRIKVILASAPADIRHRFTTKCDGEWAEVRGRSEWIGRNAEETSCWAMNVSSNAPNTAALLRQTGALVDHHDEGLGQVLGEAEDPDQGDVSVSFEAGVQDVFLEELTLHRRPIMTLSHKKNFLARARRLGKRLCQNSCSCGCGELCGEVVCVCPCCDTPYHNSGRYCCNCAESLGLDLGQFADRSGHHHAAPHEVAVQGHSSDSEFEG